MCISSVGKESSQKHIVLDSQTIVFRLHQIYKSIPKMVCYHCHHCCGPIIWFYPEELNITYYLKDHGLKKIQFNDAEFKAHQNRCPYVGPEGCIIYDARPMVCRLQGLISALPCYKQPLGRPCDEELKKILSNFKQLLVDTQSIHRFYGTRKEYHFFVEGDNIDDSMVMIPNESVPPCSSENRR